MQVDSSLNHFDTSIRDNTMINALLSDNLTSQPSLISSTTVANDIKANIRLLDQLFLQTTTCQILTGFFAWAALLITAHHVILNFY